VLENVTIDQYSRRVDFDDDSLTENTRAAYRSVFWITSSLKAEALTHQHLLPHADAFGVMPPIAASPEQAMYYFLSGYTSKLAGTEKGVKEPRPPFHLFRSAFPAALPLGLCQTVRREDRRHKVNVWLVNTGWTGGPYGVGSRLSLPYTRSMIRAVLNAAWRASPCIKTKFRRLSARECPGVPSEILHPATPGQIEQPMTSRCAS